MKTTITVAIVEDKEPIRQSLAILVDGAEGFSCQATFENAELGTRAVAGPSASMLC